MTSKKTIVIGGGVIGLSVAYHLAKQGAKDVVLLERNRLTSGTSWHAAGIVGPLRASKNLTDLASYGTELFGKLEQETGQSTGYRRTGGFWLAQTEARMIELRRIAAMGLMHNLDARVMTPAEIRERFELLSTDGLAGSVWVSEDGQINPVDLCMAYAKGARMHGAEIREQAGVAALHRSGDRVTSVVLDDGEVINAAVVINCAGLWAKEIGAMANVAISLQSVEHIYVVTESVAGLPDPCPIIRDLDSSIYLKGDAGKLVLGTFENNAKIWHHEQADPKDDFLEFPEDWDHAEPMIEAGIARVPALANLGIARFMNGPESFTPDTRQIMGKASGTQNFYVAAGFNSIGIMSSAGVGKTMAHWVIHDHPPMDVWEVDIRRFQPADSDAAFLNQRIPEAVSNQFQIHWPGKQFTTGRNRQCSPWHQLLESQGAVFGAPTGWERPLWFATNEDEQEFCYSYGEQCWWPAAEREAKRLEQHGAVFELSPFSKLMVSGPKAKAGLQRLCSNRIDVEIGAIVYSLMLNHQGGIEAECTITRTEADSWLVMTGAATRHRDLDYLQRRIDGNATINDLTDQYAVLGIMGPNSAALLSALSSVETTIAAFPFATRQSISINGVQVFASRLSYVGESGWELMMPGDDAVSVMQAVIDKMDRHSMGFAGHFCLDSCRMEKGFLHWGHDIGPDDSPLDAGLMFAVKANGDFDFIGKQAVIQLQQRPAEQKLTLFSVDADKPLLLHDEPLFCNGEWIGRTTSGALGFRTGLALTTGFVKQPLPKDGHCQIEIGGERFTVFPLSQPPYDPLGRKMRPNP